MFIGIKKSVVAFLVLGFVFGSLIHVAMPALASSDLSYGACSSELEAAAEKNHEMAPCCAEKHQGSTVEHGAPLEGAMFLAPNSRYDYSNFIDQGEALSLTTISYKKISEETIVLRI